MMDTGRIAGALMGLAAFVAAGAVGLAKGLAPSACAWRALAAGALGFLAGWIVFGKVGRSMVAEAAASDPRKGEGKPGSPPGGSER